MKKKVFCINDGYSYIAIAQSVSNDENWHKIELHYYSVTDDFQLSEIKFKSRETIKFEKMARKWCRENNLILWEY